MYRYVLFLLFTIFSTLYIYSQDNYSEEWFSADSKQLPQNSVKSIVQDKYGFVWLTTENGLVRFDGKLFETYDFIPKNMSNRMYSIEGSISSDSLFTFIDDPNHYILINQRKPSLITLDNNSKESEKIILQKGANIARTAFTTFDELKNSKQYFKTAEGNLFKISKNEISYYNSKNQLKFSKTGIFNILNFCLINDRLIYINSDLKTIVYDKYGNTNSSQPLTLKPNISFKIYTNHAAQQVFIKVNQSIYILSEKNNTILAQKIYTSELLDNTLVRTAYFDTKNDILYLGSFTDGLCVIKKKHFTTIKKASSKSEYFYAIDTISANKIISSTGTVLDKNKVIDSIPPLLKKSSLFNLIIDNKNKIWFINENKICYILNYRDKKPKDSITFSKRVANIFRGENNNLWYSTYTPEGFTKFGFFNTNEPKKSMKEYIFKEYINVLFQDKNNLWIGSVNGIYKYNLETKKTVKLNKSGSVIARSLSKTSDNTIWITTYGNGFYLIRNNELLKVPSDTGGLLNHAHCIIEDNNTLWVSTNNGIFSLDKKIIYDYFENKTNNIRYRYFDKSNGFLTNEFNGGCFPCGTKMADETIVFPSMNGVVFFKPKNLIATKTEYNFFVDKAIVDTKPIVFKDSIVLDRNFSRINIIVENPYFDYTTINRIEAKLNTSALQDWFPISDKNMITFTTLPIGTHKLLIRKFSNLNNKYEYKSITIIIPPAFWQTWWFLFIITLLTITTIIYGFKLRTNYINNQNKQLELKIYERTSQLDQTIQTLLETKKELKTRNDSQKKIINTITHDFKSPLRFLALISKNLFENKNRKIDELEENLMLVHTSSNQLYQFVDNLVQYSKAFNSSQSIENENFNLHHLINEKIDLFKNIAATQKSKIINNTPEQTIINSSRLLVSIILHNLLDNSVKNTNEGSITFNWINGVLEITDTGIGMNLKTLNLFNTTLSSKKTSKNDDNKGLGIKIVLNLIQIINAKIEFRSEIDKGTTVIIQFPKEGADLLS